MDSTSNCTICLDPLAGTHHPVATRRQFDMCADDDAVTLRCDHVFHKSCLKQQIDAYPLTLSKGHKCALCRGRISFVKKLSEEEIIDIENRRHERLLNGACDIVSTYLGSNELPDTEAHLEEVSARLAHLFSALLRTDRQTRSFASFKFDIEEGKVAKLAFKAHRKDDEAHTRVALDAPPEGLDRAVDGIRSLLTCFEETGFADETVAERVDWLHEITFKLWPSANQYSEVEWLPDPPDATHSWCVRPDPEMLALQAAKEHSRVVRDAASQISTRLDSLIEGTGRYTRRSRDHRLETVGHLIRGLMGVDAQRYAHFTLTHTIESSDRHVYRLNNLTAPSGQSWAHSNRHAQIDALISEAREQLPSLGLDPQDAGNIETLNADLSSCMPILLNVEHRGFDADTTISCSADGAIEEVSLAVERLDPHFAPSEVDDESFWTQLIAAALS